MTNTVLSPDLHNELLNSVSPNCPSINQSKCTADLQLQGSFVTYSHLFFHYLTMGIFTQPYFAVMSLPSAQLL